MHNRPMLRKFILEDLSTEERNDRLNSYNTDYKDYADKQIVYGLYVVRPADYRYFRELAEMLAYYLKDELGIGYKPALEAIVRLKNSGLKYNGQDNKVYLLTLLYKEGALV